MTLVLPPAVPAVPEIPSKTVAISIAHEVIRDLLGEALRDEGYAVQVVGPGTVTEDVARLQPDALLLEVGPWGEHVTLLDTLRSRAESSRTPVITLSLLPAQEAETQASGNVHTALPMPFDLTDLLQAMQDATGLRPAEARTVAQPLELDKTFGRTADTLSVAERAIMVQWVQVARITAPFVDRPDISPEPFLNALPRVLNMIVLGLRHQEAPLESLEAFSETKQRIQHHASLRFGDELPIEACVREYQILAHIVWQHLRRSTPADDVLVVLPKLTGLMDECVRIAVSEFNRLAVEDAKRTGVQTAA